MIGFFSFNQDFEVIIKNIIFNKNALAMPLVDAHFGELFYSIDSHLPN